MRWVVQIGFLIAFVLLVTGTVCTAFLTKDVAISEPFGLLQIIMTGGIFNLLAVGQTVIIGSLIFLGTVVLLGKAFCAWACPLGTMIDMVDTALHKLRFKPLLTRVNRPNRDADSGFLRSGMSRYAILASAMTGAAIFRSPAWCIICPIGTLCRGVAAGAEVAIGAQLVAIPAAGAFSLGEKRFWCRYLCPVGAFLTIVSRLNPFIKPRIRAGKEYRDCVACKTICPEGIHICSEKSFTRCTKCLECYAKCPHRAVTLAFR